MPKKPATKKRAARSHTKRENDTPTAPAPVTTETVAPQARNIKFPAAHPIPPGELANQYSEIEAKLQNVLRLADVYADQLLNLDGRIAERSRLDASFEWHGINGQMMPCLPGSYAGRRGATWGANAVAQTMAAGVGSSV